MLFVQNEIFHSLTSLIIWTSCSVWYLKTVNPLIGTACPLPFILPLTSKNIRIPIRSEWKLCINIAGIKLAWIVRLFGEKIKNVSSCSHVLYTTWIVVNSNRCQDEDSREMYQNEKCTCRAYRAFVFAHWSYCFVAFSQPSSSSSLRKLPKLKFGHFTSFWGRKRHSNVPKCKTHVQDV